MTCFYRRCGSVVEHTLGKGGVESPILSSGTTKKSLFYGGFFSGHRGGNWALGGRESGIEA